MTVGQIEVHFLCAYCGHEDDCAVRSPEFLPPAEAEERASRAVAGVACPSCHRRPRSVQVKAGLAAAVLAAVGLATARLLLFSGLATLGFVCVTAGIGYGWIAYRMGRGGELIVSRGPARSP